ncbi:2,3,4,5-tetrahydropyridine-2,6-dicarboxylate N-succinyltransferase [bacterium (Candidatus Blackallbacteria) CG17_big_fil_post_rev_8_21_14_2_50_48_46]|uniref:2,3,4,5-tetrahydropyridine-2,6-dicarboxylate N-succinyltransferase n=1 Tax=bacterium (Candidatus Blackallbacteria) CG17_big_fil_post_rev_8_21_14_2_50_48_46 TaxID=2014261 RepID=A0A2M7G8A0_9BACT|nr:MAG: 2,3,4,5-tetrahydropyridine-2,6-dicarboxylate N-succinyltransferase [bacterium (Candidatus Blackallbacteria) CG18_big_fil_WC_8_21_14_2_50_49_26]PIW18317.1 MAG: 2,3,4,5-tetrahydropyridine-2,6-dicarboxylate N-succinyltransferase [bacterium (Candidatus Blackallbacteria) CG17_big_fil_post_rev_8_21_14_2_50_48_46]PIW49540.1 MAG: 2,3,4,5-tetrahydropyridine-2,6-dicarboxylate N-succinyltransferase [bacterium (Candidatus Blackallbacteria) CG13_big_fil_rev_8_21_14_2_50_49_14]
MFSNSGPLLEALVTRFLLQNDAFTVLSQTDLEALSALLADHPEAPEAQALQAVVAQVQKTPPQHQSYSHLDCGFFLLSAPDQPVQSPEEAYFKLQLISQRKVKPHGVLLDGAFRVLSNLAWTNQGPILPEDLEEVRIQALLSGQPLQVSHVDKFPYLVNYHLPSGVRIASGAQVRLGAYLGEGTTIMQAGFVNFNAGTEGQAMVEGRISAGVFVGDKTDIGGGASIMGTLSGGNTHVIEIGSQCLLGANAGTGISLGDGCTLAAGLYLTAGTKVSLYNQTGQPLNLAGEVVEHGQNRVHARELSGRGFLLFYQDSVSGEVVCKPNPRTIALNPELHSHN